MAIAPATAMWIAIGVSAAGAAVSAYSAYQQGESAKKAAEYNANLYEQQASQAKEAARIKAEQAQRAYSRQMATLRAAYSGMGMELSAGTPLIVLMDSASEAAKDIERIKKGGESEASLFMGRAGLERMMGESAYKAGLMGAGTSLLGGASRATTMYYGYETSKKEPYR